MKLIKCSLLLSVALACGVVSSPALAKGRPAPTPTPPPSNVDEWNLINLSSAATAGGAGITVALLDGLTDCRHPDLSGRCTSQLIDGGRYRFYDTHGTHTAGIIAGKQYGVATSAAIRNYAVFDDRTYVATGNKLIESWRDAYDNWGARISSMSFGCTGTALCFTGDEVRAMADPTRPMLYVKASGNDGADLPNEQIAVSYADGSAALARTILVGSVDVNGNISSFSNKPGAGCLAVSDVTGCASNLLWKNHFIVAPGENIYSTIPGGGYAYLSGTSMATPVVSGVAALLQAKWPALKQDPVTLAEILLTTATDKGAQGVDEVYGWGLLNVANAFSAQGTITYQGLDGTITPLSGSTITSGGGAMAAGLAAALGRVTVYDKFGRDFTLAETHALNFRHDFRAARRMLGRRLLGSGSQRDWTAAFFADEPQARGFAMFGSAAEVQGAQLSFDNTLRMGVDLPFKGGLAQLRLTGTTNTRTDFAYDPSLRPLGFFASSDMMKAAIVGNALFRLQDGSRLMIYGTTTTGSLQGYKPMDPLELRATEDGYMPQLALRSDRLEQHRTSFGVGYWKKIGEQTVLGVNASIMTQTGGYYDLTSNLADFDRPTRMFNLGVAMSHTMGSWELVTSGELTHLRMSGATNVLRFTPANLVSAELGFRKSGVAFAGRTQDSLGVSFVLPPRAISGSIRADYLTRTPDGLGRMAASYEVPLSHLGSEQPRIEAAYRLTGSKGWTLDLTGGTNLGNDTYTGGAETMAKFSLAF